MSDFLTGKALRRALRKKKKEPPRLEQILGKYFLVEIISIIEIVAQRSYALCYCYKYSVCSPHEYYPPHSTFGNQYFCCESCQVWTYFCDFFLDNRAADDARHLIRVAIDIFERRNKIIENVGRASEYFDIKLKYTFFVGCFIEDDRKSLTELVDPYELFVNYNANSKDA